MDDIARFLKFLLSTRDETFPKTSSFDKLKKSIVGFEGQRFEELKSIILSTPWFDSLKNLRDKPIIHRGDRDSGIGIRDRRIGIHLRYIQDRKIREQFISNKEIDTLISDVHHFLVALNWSLCKNFNYLPLKIRLVCINSFDSAKKRDAQPMNKGF